MTGKEKKMVKTRRQSKTNQSKKIQATNLNKPHRLRTPKEAISEISPLSVRLLKTNLDNLIELQSEKNLSFNFLLNSIVMDFFKNNKEGNLSVSH